MLFRSTLRWNRTKARQASESADYNTLTWPEKWTRYQSLFLLTSRCGMYGRTTRVTCIGTTSKQRMREKAQLNIHGHHPWTRSEAVAELDRKRRGGRNKKYSCLGGPKTNFFPSNPFLFFFLHKMIHTWGAVAPPHLH